MRISFIAHQTGSEVTLHNLKTVIFIFLFYRYLDLLHVVMRGIIRDLSEFKVEHQRYQIICL